MLEPRGLWAWKVPAVVMESHRCPAGGQEGFSLWYLRYAVCTDKLAQTQPWLVVEPQFLLALLLGCWFPFLSPPTPPLSVAFVSKLCVLTVVFFCIFFLGGWGGGVCLISAIFRCVGAQNIPV